MKIFLAGGSGVIGRRLIPQLRAKGHTVVATTTTAAKSGLLRELGATPVANPPSEFAAFVKQDTEKWRRLVATAKIQVEQ